MRAATRCSASADHRALLLQRLDSHIRAVVARYADIVDSWDVVNEVIDAGQPGGLRQTPWLQIIGPDYIDAAFRITREVDPDAKLYINDFSTTDPAKRAALFNVVNGLLARGVPVDGVGHQMHVNIAQPSVEAIGATIELFAGLELDNQITEFDMSVYTNSTDSYVPTVPEEILVLQGHRYKDIFREFRRLKDSISSVTLWGLADDTTWLKRFPITRLDQPLLFDEDLQAKHAYWGVVDPSRLPVLIQKLDVSAGTPRVDGRSELRWDLVKPVAIPSDGPLSAAFKALWDGTSLYVLAEVTDATPRRDDAIEIFIDGDHFVFERFGRFWCRPRRAGQEHPRWIVVPIRGGYRLEAAIPLDGAAPGRQIGFDVRIRDAGDPPSFVSWSDTTHSQDTDTSNWGVITLVSEIELADAARGTPTIDGVEERTWKNATSIATGKFILGTSGSTAVVKTLWDSGHLYVFARVTDSLLSKASSNPWEQDSIEIFIDQNNGKTTEYEGDDAQYRVNFENTQSFGGAGSAAKFVTATRIVEGGYVVEAAIALDAIRPKPGLLIGFDAQVNNDELGDGMRASVATWNDESGRAFQDPSRFGVLRLVLR
jgi:endo-1,4-beta-xylanase